MSGLSPIDQIEAVRNRLAFFLVLAFVGVIPFLLYRTIPAENKEILVYIIGQLSGMATTALGFYFVNKVGQDALDATRAANTGKMAEAVTTALKTSDKATAAGDAADQVAEAATDKADEIKGEPSPPETKGN